MLALASASMSAALAQSHEGHTAPTAGSTSQPAMTTMDSMDSMDGGTASPTVPMDHGAMNHAAMNHGGMDMGGMDMGSSSTAPADARDPHGYSNGYTLNTGPYAQKDTSALMMSDMHSFGSFLVDRLERVHTRNGNSVAYDTQGWIGNSYDKFYLKAEGDI
ncbi:copper resistance protein CopB, partial [Herbaspirillum sp. VT-16-41]